MCRPLITAEKRQQVARDGTMTTTVVTLPWMLAFGAQTLRVVHEMQAEHGKLTQIARYRTAGVLPKYPGGWETISGSTLTANGLSVVDQSMTGITNKMWVQVALAASGSSTAPAESYSMVRAALHTGGKLLARRRLQLQPEVNSGEAMFLPVCEPRPALGFSDFMFATVLFGLDGEITYQPAYRLFASDRIQPGVWNTLGTAQSGVTADENVNFGTMSVSPGTSMFVQPGLKVTSSTNDVRGTIDVLVAGEWG